MPMTRTGGPVMNEYDYGVCLGIPMAVAQVADRYAAGRMAATAAAKAKRLWPDVIGEVLADQIMTLPELPSWLRPQTRTQRLIDVILGITE